MRHKHSKLWSRMLLLALASSAIPAMQSAVTTLNFNTDPGPTGLYREFGNGASKWRPDGGSSGAVGDGYLALTDAKGGQQTCLVFKDLENGLVVKAFTFEADIRVGGGTSRPADGISINYVRLGDQLLADADAGNDPTYLDFAGTDGEPHLPEEGSQTGLGIGFDTWASGAEQGVQDYPGISIRVDGKLIAQLPVPLTPGVIYNLDNAGTTFDDTPYRNLPTTDANYLKSQQTGALGGTTEDLNGDGVVDANDLGLAQPTDDDPTFALWYKHLVWEKLRAELTSDAHVKVTYKGVELTPAGGLPVDYSPSGGRIVLAGRTGGAWEMHHFDNIVLTTVPSDKAVLGSALGNAISFNFTISDSGPSTVVDGSIKVKLDGTTVAVTTSKDQGITTATYANTGAFFASGSVHSVDVEFKEAQGTTITGTRTFTTSPYATVPAADATTAATSGSGFRVFVHQLDQGRGPGDRGVGSDSNLILNAETAHGGGATDDNGVVLPDVASPGDQPDGSFLIDVVNVEQNATAIGNFKSSGTGDNLDVADENIPGIPGTSGSLDNITGEYQAYISLKRGMYRLGVNSDDGFKVSVAPGFDAFGTVLGKFDGGRGSSDTLFDIVAEADGVYPIRLLWWEGGGGANTEFFTVDLVTGKKFLINQPGGLLTAKPTGHAGAYVKSFVPWPGYTAQDPHAPIKAVLVDDLTSVDQASIVLTYDGATVTPTVVHSGKNTTVTYQPAGGAYATAHSGTFSYKLQGSADVRTINYNYTTRKPHMSDLAASSFWIEGEDYNFGSGKTLPEASVMPYAGGAYGDATTPADGKVAVLDTDYHDTDGNDSDVYRPDTAPNNVNITTQLGNQNGTTRPGAFDLTGNYRLGWVGNTDWYNYTRTVPAGLYNAYALLSYGDASADSMRAVLSRVTTDPTKPNQAIETLGVFHTTGSGAWGASDLVKAKSPTGDGSDAVVKIKTAAPTTFRFAGDSGDYDGFILVPVAGVLPKLTSASPANGGYLPRNTKLTFKITDESTALNAASVALTFDGAAVTPTVTKADDVTTVAYDPGQASIGSHAFQLSWADTAGAAQTYAGNYTANVFGTTGQFLIESEDFNYGGGLTKDAASAMPYTGNAYNGLSAVNLVDYTSNDGNDSDVYRLGENPNMDINDNGGDNNRGLWTNTANYKIGWTDNGDWANYTRNVPAGNYEVWIGLSHGNTGATDCRATLQKVTNPTSAAQTVEQLGSFVGVGTGGWGTNRLLPMQDAGGNKAVLSLNGSTTLRVTLDSGDFDYFVLIPGTASVPLAFTSTVLNADGTITITWTGGGTLGASPTIDGTYTDVVGAASPFTFAPTAAQLFGKLHR